MINTPYAAVAQNWGDYSLYNKRSTAAWRHVIGSVKDVSVLDLGCGDGTDLVWFLERGAASVAGVDSDDQMILCALKRGLEHVHHARAETLPFDSESFDFVVSKWALQACEDLRPVYREAYRVLRFRGHLVFLLVHPLRQFMEQKRCNRDYWSREEVESVLFDGQLTVKEPMHTMEDVLGNAFLDLFILEQLHENMELGVEHVDSAQYPHYVLFRAQKRA